MSSSRPALSLTLIVKNEGRCLARCLKSIQTVVEEIVVVDTGSTDGTLGIARDFNAKVSSFVWCDDFSAARNYALAQTTGDWILVLDADEYASEDLRREITEFVRRGERIGRLRILSVFRKHGQTLTSQSFVSRLFPRGAHFEGSIHEQLVSALPRVNLKAELWHDGYLDLGKSERNLKLLLGELERSPNHAYYLFQLAQEYSSLNQADKAFHALQRAFALARPEDPFAPNVVVDYLYSIIEMRQFDLGAEVIQQGGVFFGDFPDFHFVSGLFYMQAIRADSAKYISWLPRIEQCFQRCLALGETTTYKSVQGTGTFLAHYNLGTLYHVFGDAVEAHRCFEKAASLGYEPAIQMLKMVKASSAS